MEIKMQIENVDKLQNPVEKTVEKPSKNRRKTVAKPSQNPVAKSRH
jgi:hypothetical protein